MQGDALAFVMSTDTVRKSSEIICTLHPSEDLHLAEGSPAAFDLSDDQIKHTASR